MSNKIISVLMPSLNNATFIDEAICSCLEQRELLEVIIFDGGSCDKAISRIKYWTKKDNRIKLYIEADSGPSEALNKALSIAKGDYIGWLNSDDKYEQNALKRGLNKLEENKNLKIVYGHGQHIDSLGRFIEYYPTLPPYSGIKKFQDGCFICQPTVLFRKEIFHEVGKFDISIKTCFDFDLWLKVFQKYNYKEIGFVDDIQASSRLHKNTITDKQYWRINIESYYLLNKYLGVAKDHWLEQAARILVINKKTDAIGYLERSEANKFLDENQKVIYNNYVNQFCSREDKNSIDRNFQKKEFPKSLQILLNNRVDLQNCGFDSQKNERTFCIWLIKHGVNEYPFLFEGNIKNNKLLKWLSEKNNKNNSRIIQAIWDSNENLRRFWIFKKYKKLLKIFLFFNRKSYFHSTILSYSSFFKPFYSNLYEFLLLKIKKINFFNKNSIYQNQINLIGYSNYESGIGKDLITTAESLEFMGIKTNIIKFQANVNKRGTEIAKRNIKSEESNVIIICLNPFDCFWNLSLKLDEYFGSHYLIGYMPWEFKKWPEELEGTFNYLDEIWTASNFVYDSLNKFKKPKRIMPLCIEYNKVNLSPLNKSKKSFYRNKYKIPKENLVFLCAFDLESYVERKNPWGAIKAFQQAFNPSYPNQSNNEKVNLLIKTFKPFSKNRDWEKLKNYAKLDKRIKIIEDDLNFEELINLFGCCDVLLSLHRSEGFGRIIAECIQLGLEIITTNWGGNTDFCDEKFIHLVPFNLIEVLPGTYPFWKGQVWADPDLEKCGEYMKDIFKGKRLNSEKYRISIKKLLSKEKCGKRYKNRIKEISDILSDKKF